MEEVQLQEEFIVTARKWRPLRFGDIVGQEHIVTTLKNAISENRIHHAYLFSGPRGVGKTTAARILARAVNCLAPVDSEPCNKCGPCMTAMEGRSLDVIEIDGASNNSVDDVRKLRENAKYPPVVGNYKLYVIDEVHMLSTSAFNALLKTLEEPPPHLMFVFATTESHKVPATIISRCQRFDFRRMELSGITDRLKFIAKSENIEIDEESLFAIARKADGSMRDAQSIFDQVIAFCGRNVTFSVMADALHLIDQEFFFKVSTSIANKNLQEIYRIASEIVSKGYDLSEVLHGLMEHFRNILTVVVTGSAQLIETSSAIAERYTAEAKHFGKHDILRLITLLQNTEQAMKYAAQPRIRFEIALTQMAMLDSTIEISQLIDEVKSLKQMLVSGGKLPPISTQKQQPSTDRVSQNAPTYTSTPQPTPIHTSTPNLTEVPKKIEEPSTTQFQEKTLKKIHDSKWFDYLEHLSRTGAPLNMLDQVEANIFDGEILLKTDDSFVLGYITNKKQLISASISEFFGKPFNLKIALTDKIEEPVRKNYSTNIQESSDNFNTSSSNIQSIDYNFISENQISNDNNMELADKFKDKHPVEVEIIKLFGKNIIP
ncbi:MAG: polymerase subunit tau [Ignavibacteria bacterium]|nr:polymerase subunit tau [Ignavibacteria bacterium]